MGENCNHDCSSCANKCKDNTDFSEKLNELSSVKKVIGVISGKGGVGKSNVAVNLALELINKGKRVLIIDADLGLANVEILMGMIPKYNLKEVIDGEKTISEIICDGPNGLKFISGGSGIENLANLSEDKLMRVANDLASLDELFDVIIIDTGAGINETVMTFAKVADEVATPVLLQLIEHFRYRNDEKLKVIFP